MRHFGLINFGLAKRFLSLTIGGVVAIGASYFAEQHIEASANQKIERWLAFHYLPDTEETRIARDVNQDSFRNMGERGFVWGFLAATAGGAVAWGLTNKEGNAAQKRAKAQQLIAEAESEEIYLATMKTLKELTTNADSH